MKRLIIVAASVTLSLLSVACDNSVPDSGEYVETFSSSNCRAHATPQAIENGACD